MGTERGLDLSDEELLLAYADNEAAVERETPAALYPEVLAAAFRRTGARLHGPVSDEWAQRRLRRQQPAAARRLRRQHHRAEDAGAYKPAENHFRALDNTLAGLGVDRTELLHVAQSLFHDHIPAKREGLASRRHDRPGWEATPEPAQQWSYNLAFNSMADFAHAVDQAFNDAPRTND